MLHQIPESFEDLAEDALNAEGRSRAHVATGAALIAGAVLASALIAYRASPPQQGPVERARLASLRKPPFQPPKQLFAAVWPPMFLLLTVSGLRVWNAPASRERTRALGFWGAIQGLNAASLLWGARGQTGQLLTNLAGLGAALGYAKAAKTVDPPSAAVVAPYVGWMTFANLLTEELWRRNKGRPGIR